ncbi:hypothetical protein QJS04_geneDACA019488 [Acorus gramineus]|uniref:Uncharacterized protein n=1 Tax=Acorus gramineus TaxID=55184 RepID=A0AAV9AAP4_ACOGR|nr:hypothetical protein QJS04_geneDACA019488 [Acorus gramineus]
MNNALLMKWLWRWLSAPNLLWCWVISSRYGCDGSHPHRFPRPGQHLFSLWKAILEGCTSFSEAVRWRLGSRSLISFWHDLWIGELTLKERFPSIFQIAADREGGVHWFWSPRGETGFWEVQVHRNLNDDEVESYVELLELLQECELVPSRRDEVVWRPKAAEGFSVRSGYQWLRRETPPIEVHLRLGEALRRSDFHWVSGECASDS